MPRITLTIDNSLLRLLKERAADEGRKPQDVAIDLLRQALTSPKTRPFKLCLESWEAQEKPGIDLFNRNQLFDRMDER